MLTRASISISENIDHLTTPFSSHFLVCGEYAILIDTCVSAGYSYLEKGLVDFLENLQLLRGVALTNAHFNHIAALPLLRRRCPTLEVHVSRPIARLLSDMDYMKKVYEQDLAISADVVVPDGEEVEPIGSFEAWVSAFSDLKVTMDGDQLDLGLEVQIRVVECPGHRMESTAYYISPDKALAAGEATGAYFGRGELVPSFGYSYSGFRQAFDKFMALDILHLGQHTRGVLSGDLVARYLADCLVEADNFAAMVRERLRSGEVVDDIARAVFVEWTSRKYSPTGPFKDEQKQLIHGMVKAVVDNH